MQLVHQVERAKRGDAVATEAVAAAALTQALRVAAAILGDRDAAAEVAQEAAIEAILGLPRLRRERAFEAYVRRIAVRGALRAADGRRRAAAERAPLETLEMHTAKREQAGPHEMAEGREAMRALAQALEVLPERQRVALALRLVLGLTEREIASALGCRPGTVGALISRGRATLRMNPAIRALASVAGEENAR
ncbi:MAG: RNA polymerase sigma factor [Thermoleophilia bacterium]